MPKLPLRSPLDAAIDVGPVVRPGTVVTTIRNTHMKC